MPEVINKLERSLAREVISDLLCESIANNMLKPGERMNAHELAHRLG